MTNEKIDEFSEKYHKDLSKEQLSDLKDRLENANEEVFDKLERAKVKSTSTTVKLSAFLGLFGAGSFYLGRIKAGILKVVFNVVVPLVIAMLFFVWLSPTNKSYYNQSLDVTSKVYGVVANSDETFDVYSKYLISLQGDDFSKALNTVKEKYDDAVAADEILLTSLTDADAVKGVLDGLNLEEITVEQTNISVKIGFGELLPNWTVTDLDLFKEKFTAVSALALQVMTNIGNVSTTDSETVAALNAISSKAQALRTKLITFLDDRQKDSLSSCVGKIKSEIAFYSNLKSPFDDFYSKNKVENAVDKKIRYNSLCASISERLATINTTVDLSEIAPEITAIMSEISSLSSNAVSATQDYLIGYKCDTWIPFAFLCVDGIIIICWWIGEVFRNRDKCYDMNYQKLLAQIN